jgi:hypothetical protein
MLGERRALTQFAAQRPLAAHLAHTGPPTMRLLEEIEIGLAHGRFRAVRLAGMDDLINDPTMAANLIESSQEGCLL